MTHYNTSAYFPHPFRPSSLVNLRSVPKIGMEMCASKACSMSHSYPPFFKPFWFLTRIESIQGDVPSPSPYITGRNAAQRGLVQNGTAGDIGTTGGILNQPVPGFLVG